MKPREIGVNSGDFVAIEGRGGGRTVARVWPSDTSDAGHGIIRIDGQRLNTTGNGTATVTTTRSNTVVTARYEPGRWWRNTPGYVGDSAKTHVGGTALEVVVALSRFSSRSDCFYWPSTSSIGSRNRASGHRGEGCNSDAGIRRPFARRQNVGPQNGPVRGGDHRIARRRCSACGRASHLLRVDEPPVQHLPPDEAQEACLLRAAWHPPVVVDRRLLAPIYRLAGGVSHPVGVRISLFQTLSFTEMGVLWLVFTLSTDFVLFVLIGLIYLVRQLVLYLFVLLMPILIVFWIPGVSPFS